MFSIPKTDHSKIRRSSGLIIVSVLLGLAVAKALPTMWLKTKSVLGIGVYVEDMGAAKTHMEERIKRGVNGW